MFYTYVLFSEKDKMVYTGYTKDLRNRFRMHQNGKIKSTANRRPLLLIYYESCLNQQDATRREKYIKSGNGKIYLKSRLRNYWENKS